MGFELISLATTFFSLDNRLAFSTWQYEDIIWGLFMAKYIFPGADASTPLNWYIEQLERAGFEVQSSESLGTHYSATIWRW